MDSLLNACRFPVRCARTFYGGLRSLKNHSLNLIDSPTIILLYHRVSDLESDPEMLAVSPENFRRQMKYLKENFRVLRFEEDGVGQGVPSVVVTFDDGYADNYLEALPILEEVGVPATFFVSTGNLGTWREFWWHQLEGLLLHGGPAPARFTLKDIKYGRSWETGTPEGRRRLYAALNMLMQKVGPERREDWLEQVRRWATSDGEGESGTHRCLSVEELRGLAASPWTTIGAHTVTHSALSALDEGEQRMEIFTSRQKLEEILGQEVTTFSYPFGRRCDYNPTSVRLCREAGFQRVASNFPGQVRQWTDPLQLPRHLVRNWSMDTFTMELRRFWTR